MFAALLVALCGVGIKGMYCLIITFQCYHIQVVLKECLVIECKKHNIIFAYLYLT